MIDKPKSQFVKRYLLFIDNFFFATSTHFPAQSLETIQVSTG